jgi:hypothetical protein
VYRRGPHTPAGSNPAGGTIISAVQEAIFEPRRAVRTLVTPYRLGFAGLGQSATKFAGGSSACRPWYGVGLCAFPQTVRDLDRLSPKPQAESPSNSVGNTSRTSVTLGPLGGPAYCLKHPKSTGWTRNGLERPGFATIRMAFGDTLGERDVSREYMVQWHQCGTHGPVPSAG